MRAKLYFAAAAAAVLVHAVLGSTLVAVALLASIAVYPVALWYVGRPDQGN